MRNEIYEYEKANLQIAIADMRDEVTSNYYQVEREMACKPVDFNLPYFRDLSERCEQLTNNYKSLVELQNKLNYIMQVQGE